MRKIVQFISFFLVNYVILELLFNTKFDILGDIFKVLPFLHSARSTWARGGGLLEYTFYSINSGIFPFLFLGIIGLLGLFTNRIFCGWMCPTGLLSDLFSGLSGENRKMSIGADKSLKKFKTFLLFIMFLLFIPLGYYAAKDFVNYVAYSEALGDLVANPLGPFSFSEFLFVTIPAKFKYVVDNLNFKDFFDTTKPISIVLFFIYIFIIALSVYYPRFYCRFICPYAALISIFSEYSLMRLQRLPTRCPGRKECGECEKVCPMQIRILDEPYDGFTGGGECIMCLQCYQDCPHNAVKWKFGV
jgi:polyferredoxin